MAKAFSGILAAAHDLLLDCLLDVHGVNSDY